MDVLGITADLISSSSRWRKMPDFLIEIVVSRKVRVLASVGALDDADR